MKIPRSIQIQAKIIGGLSLLLGASFAIVSFSFLNNPIDKKESPSSKQAIVFEVKHEINQQKTVSKSRIIKKGHTKPATPPAFSLDLSLDGIDIGLDQFTANDMGNVDDNLLGDISNVAMTSDMVDVSPSVRFKSTMAYPARAKAKEIEGFVTISILINTTGKIETIKIIESEPVGVFDRTVLRTVKKWTFDPARYKGKPVQTWANQTIRFELG